MSQILEDFLRFQKEWGKLTWDNEDNPKGLECKKQMDILKDQFTKQDWLDLIAQSSSNTAKLGYTEQMKAKFGE